MRLRLSLMAALALAVGCTHRQLADSTVLTTTTVVDIQQRIVLDNLARMSAQPEALPSHIDLADGVVQINDEAGFGSAGGFDTGLSPGFSLNPFGPNASRQVTEQWGADATTDPERLIDLQDLYRVALGLAPLPPTNAIAYMRERERQSDRRKEPKNESKDGPDAPAPKREKDPWVASTTCRRTPATSATMATGTPGSCRTACRASPGSPSRC